MTLDRLTQITSVGITSGITLNNATLTGVTTIASLDSVSVGGTITAVDGNFSGNITAVGATFSGNVSIAGTLTYEDVTNIDSIGIITARDTIDAQGNVTVGAGLSVVGVSTLGNTVVGGATTELVVGGDARITGILTVGSSSITIDGTTNTVSTTNLTVNGNAYPSAGPLSNRNLIINGNFAINQRGGSNTTINTYALDRWRSYGGPMGFTISQQDVLSTLSTSKYALRLQRTSGNTQTNNIGVAQGIESKNCEGLAGTQLTLSFKARAGANLSGDFAYIVFFGTGTDENPVGMTGQTSDVSSVSASTDWTSYTKTVNVPAGTTQITVGFSFTPAGTAGTNDWFEVAEVQVERGSVATPFEHRSYGNELARCERYYQVYGNVFGILMHNYTSGQAFGGFPLRTPMRANAAADYILPYDNAATAYYSNGGAKKTLTALTLNASSTNFIQLTVTGTLGTGGDAGHLDINSVDAIKLQAEL